MLSTSHVKKPCTEMVLGPPGFPDVGAACDLGPPGVPDVGAACDLGL